MKNKYVFKRHKRFFVIFKIAAFFVSIVHHYKAHKYKLDKNKNYFVLSNHQAYFDPLLLGYTLNKQIYYIANDSLGRGLIRKLLDYFIAPIRIKKGTVDVSTIRNSYKIAKEGGSIGLFPEGNTAWADFQFYIDKSIVRFIRLLNLPLVLFNFSGGYGSNPRWGNKFRKGPYEGKVSRIIEVDELNTISDDDLYEIVLSTLKVIDSKSGNSYESNKKAEYLERVLFVCPSCSSTSTLISNGNHISCKKCNLKVEYTSNLSLKSDNVDFKFNKLIDWYIYQQDFVKNYSLANDKIILEDDNISIYSEENRKKTLSHGKMVLTSTSLSVGNFSIPINKVTNSSAFKGTNINLNTIDSSFFVSGNDRFNPIKYLLFFNILCDEIKQKGDDKYYGLTIDSSNR